MAPYCFPVVLPLLSTAWIVNAFVAHPRNPACFSATKRCWTPPRRQLHAIDPMLSLEQGDLFEEEEEMMPIAEAFVHAKYKECAQSHGHDYMTKDDAREVLRSLLPPVTPEELDEEVVKTLAIIMQNPENEEDKINEDCFVNAIIRNSYWKAAGDLVVKELMYFDALYHYYRTKSSLLNDEHYGDLKDNLTWEGSSVATMNAREALFVTAVAAARRGEPIMDDAEYAELKSELQKQGSWVANRGQDALEKLGLNTFMGYLHRAL